MRKKIVAGNWKMNLNKAEAADLLDQLGRHQVDDVQLEVYVSALHVPMAMDKVGDQISIGIQNCYCEEKGAYTGEISAAMALSYGCESVLIGHSERRQIFGESNEFLKQKVNLVLSQNLNVMFCVGETLDQREAGNAETVVKQQLQESLFHLSAEQIHSVVIAYEPVWAIGTGKTATPEQAQEMHAFIRQEIENNYSAEVANEISILYGGSVKPTNAKEIFAQSDIDGGLIGGASLQADSFIEIARSF